MNKPKLPRSRASDWEEVERRGREIRAARRYKEKGELPSWEEIELQSRWDAGWKKRKRKREDAWTTYKKIGQIISDGRTTGEDFEATFERLGRSAGERDKNPNAKPGEPGHRRKMFPSNVNPDFPGEKKAQKKRSKKLSAKIMNRAWKQEVAKNVVSRANRRSPTMGHATDLGDMVRQEQEKQDFRVGMGDTSDLTKAGLKKNIQKRSKAAVKRGKASVNEVAPPGWGHTKTGGKKSVKVGGSIVAMKKAKAQGRMPGVKNIFALAWSMKNRGDTPHYKPKKKGVLKKKYRKKS